MMGRKKWSEMSPRQRVSIGIGVAVQVTLLGVALWDIRRRSAEEVRGPKLLWSMVAFINYVGPISYFVVGRKRH